MRDRFAPPGLLLLIGVLISAQALAAEPAKPFSGVWRDVDIGYNVQFVQNGNRVEIRALEAFSKPGYDDVVPGMLLGTYEQTSSSELAGTAIAFTHPDGVRKCNLPRSQMLPSAVSISNDGKIIRGTGTSTNVRTPSCQLEKIVHDKHYEFISGQTAAGCELGVPPGKSMRATNYRKFYSKYVKGILMPGSAILTGREMRRRAGYAADIAGGLIDSHEVLAATVAAGELFDNVRLLSAIVKPLHSTQRNTEGVRAVLDAKSQSLLLGDLPVCIGPVADNEYFYELNLYALKKETCKNITRSITKEDLMFRSVAVNGKVGGACIDDTMLAGTHDGSDHLLSATFKGKVKFAKAGRNQITLIVNSMQNIGQ